MTEYTIRHRTLGNVGGFESMTAATMTAIAIGWPLEDWTIELVEVLTIPIDIEVQPGTVRVFGISKENAISNPDGV